MERRLAPHQSDQYDMPDREHWYMLDRVEILAHLRGGHLVPSSEDPLAAPVFLSIERPGLPPETLLRLANVICSTVADYCPGSLAARMIHEAAAGSLLEEIGQALGVLHELAAITEETVAHYRADLEDWYRIAYGRSSASVLNYKIRKEEGALAEYRDALTGLMLALWHPRSY